MSDLSASLIASTPAGPLPGAEPLRAMVDKFNFEDGAVLVQVPQVPPSLIEHAVARNRGYFAYPPQGLFYLSAEFRELGLETAIVDLNYEMLRAAQTEAADIDMAWKDALDETLATFDQPFICISFMFDATYSQLVEVSEHIRATRPGLAIAVGGVAATADPDRILKLGMADFVFANEGEMPLAAFYNFIRGKLASLPPNLSFLDTNGEVVSTPKITGSKIDADLRAEYDKLPLFDYCNVGSLTNFSRMRGVDVPFATIISRRGCRARCTFCSVRNFNGKSVRIRDTDNIIDEMLYLRENFGIEHFNWLDDDPLYDRDAARELYEKMAERLPGITWDANNGMIASSVTPDLLEALEKSGCIGFTVGLETGNPEILRKIKKPASIERFREFATMTKDFPKLFYTINFILGLPEERIEQALDSFKLALNVKLNWNNFFLFQPLKNTDIHKAYGGMEDNITEDELIRRGTTVNFNAARSGKAQQMLPKEGVLTGYDIFDLDPKLVADKEQRTEVWFTFNYVVNFLRNPALTSGKEDVIRLAVRWFSALGQAYADNPSIDCMSYFLRKRIGEDDAETLQGFRDAAARKFAASGYWRIRDEQFRFTTLLDGKIPDLDPRAARYIDAPADQPKPQIKRVTS